MNIDETLTIGDAIDLLEGAASYEDPINYRGEETTPEELRDMLDGDGYKPANGVHLSFYGVGGLVEGTLLDMVKDRTILSQLRPDGLDLALPDPRGLGLLDTVDMIRGLRAEADSEYESRGYDPHGHTEKRVKAMREHADEIERRMEVKLGWNR